MSTHNGIFVLYHFYINTWINTIVDQLIQIFSD